MKVCKVNIDEEAELAARYGVMSIPMLVIKNGAVVNTAICVKNEQIIAEML